jgi:DNA topoisomerase-1
MIAWSLAYVLKLKNPKRIVFNSITKTELLEAVQNPVGIDMDMVNSQKARRILDRIVGFELSPLLWKHIKAKSAGRVQSVVVRLIIDRENEINDFIENNVNSFFKFNGRFYSLDDETFDTVLYDLSDVNKDGHFKGTITKIDNYDDAKEFIEVCSESVFTVSNIYDKPSISSPSQPFTTSTLQQEASRRLYFKAKRTMRAAQNLYENGLITYMRTDSVNLSKEALKNIKDYILKTYGKEYYHMKKYTGKGKHTQEAHEAIRPTDIFTTEDKIEMKNKIGSDEIKLYSLIWKRTLACQMVPAEYKITTIQIAISEDDTKYFMTTIKNLVFDGYLIVYGNETEDVKISLPDIDNEIDISNISAVQEYSKPPTRFNEASLVQQLDPKNLNIGRPATYASIISKIQDRGYVKIDSVTGIKKQSVNLIWDASNNEIEEKTKEITIGSDKNKFIPN